MTVPFDDICVPCGEVTMQISRALYVLEMFSLYLIQGYKSVLVSGIPVISKNDLWLTLLTRLIWISPAYPWLIWILSYYFLTPRTSKHSRFWYRALSHPAPYSCYLLYPNSTNLVILVHFRLATSLFGRTHKSIFISGNMVHFSYSYPVTQSW